MMSYRWLLGNCYCKQTQRDVSGNPNDLQNPKYMRKTCSLEFDLDVLVVCFGMKGCTKLQSCTLHLLKSPPKVQHDSQIFI